MKRLFPFFFGSISTCLSMCLRRYFRDIVFNPLDFVLITLVLLSLIAMYQWLSFRKVKMPRMIFHLILYILTILVVVIVRDWVFHLIAVGAIASSCMMMDASGPRGDDHSSSSFFEGLSDWIKKTTEPGEERNSQPSQGVGQRLPGSLEISSPGISGESLFRGLEQPRSEPAPQPEVSSSAPNIPPVEPPTTGYKTALNANERQAWEELMYSEEYKYMDRNLTKCGDAVEAISQRVQDIFDQNGIQIEDPKDIRIAVDLYFEETMEKDPVERLNALIRAYRALPDSNLCHEILKEIREW